MSKLVTAYDTRTGKQRQVPVNWFDHENLSAGLSRTDPRIPLVAPDGVNQVARPDDRNYDGTNKAAQPAKESRAKKFATGGPVTPPTDSNPGDPNPAQGAEK